MTKNEIVEVAMRRAQWYGTTVQRSTSPDNQWVLDLGSLEKVDTNRMSAGRLKLGMDCGMSLNHPVPNDADLNQMCRWCWLKHSGRMYMVALIPIR